MFNSNIWPKCPPLRDIRLWNPSFTIQIWWFHCNLHIWFQLVFSHDVESNCAPLGDIRLQNLSDLGFDLSWSVKGKCNGVVRLHVRVPISIWLVTTCLSLSVICYRHFKKFNIHLSLITRLKFRSPPHTGGIPLPRGNFFSQSNLIISFLGQKEPSHQKWSWLVQYFLRY